MVRVRVRFFVAKQNKSRLETKARSHAAADSTGPPARGRGAEKGGSRSVGVSRGGRNTKVHVVSGSGSMLVRIHLSPGDEHDAAHGCRSMAALGAFVGALCFVKFLWAVSAFLLVRLSGCF